MKEFDKRTKHENLMAAISRHEVSTIEEYEEQALHHPERWEILNAKVNAEQWINKNAEMRGKTYKEYLRMVLDSGIFRE